jgi:general secretion pathway protein K
MTPNNDRGIALIVVLWIAAILCGIALTGAYTARLELRQAYYPAAEQQLLGAAVTAVENVKLALREDDNEYDSLKERWKTGFSTSTTAEGVTTAVAVEDEESKCNLAAASKERLLPAPIFDGFPDREELVDSLLDWQDSDGQPRARGAEAGDYARLTPPRPCKDRQLDCLDELSLVKGFTPKVLARARRFATVCTDGRININTAPVETLMTLPGVDYLKAQAIIARRNGKDLRQGTADDLPYDTPQRLEEVLGAALYAKISDLVTVSSSHFKVTVTAKAGKYSTIVETLLSRQGNGSVKVVYWRER